VIVGAMNVAVLGAGIVGRTLATGWARAGHHIVLGSRDPDAERVRDAVAETGASGAAEHPAAARSSDVAVVTVPGEQVDALVAQVGDALAGRVVVDATNVLAPGAPDLHHVDALRAAGATVFRAFSTTGWEQMAKPLFGDQRCDLPWAGPDEPGRDHVEQLVTDLGLRPVWFGDDAEALELMDALTRVWFRLAFRQGWGRRTGLRFLTDDTRPDVS
jgi:predicted dinucleotide-binding enzyme